MYCRKCGKEIPNDSVYCSYCGTKQIGNNLSHGKSGTNGERGWGKRGLLAGRTGSFPVPPKNSAPAEKYYSARCKVLHGALQSVSPNAENLAFLFSLTFPDFTRHFFSSLAETVDSSFVVVLNR